MRRIVAAIIAFTMVVGIVLSPSINTKAAGQSLTTKQSEVNVKNQQLNKQVLSAGNILPYISSDSSYNSLLTNEEIRLLLNPTPATTVQLTQDQALSDSDILNRAFKSSSATYNLFGQVNFDLAKSQLDQWIMSQTSVNINDMKQKINEIYSFVRDGHCYIADYSETQPNYQYRYAYASEQSYFTKGEDGSYYLASDPSWKLVSFNDANIFMADTLDMQGNIMCLPSICVPITMFNSNAQMTLMSTSGTMKNVSIDWTMCLNYRDVNPIDYSNSGYRYISEEGITYISVRSYARGLAGLEEFVNSASTAKRFKSYNT